MTRVDSDDLREVAKRAGLTGEQAAAIIGVHPRTWQKWVGGERECPLAAYEWLRVVTGQNPDYGYKRGR